MSGVVRRTAKGALIAMLVLVSNAVEACSPGCDVTELTLTPIDRSALDGPVTLEARLTVDGDGVQGAAVVFFVLRTGLNTNTKGRAIGNATTDTKGLARISFRAGLASVEPPPYVIHGYSAQFRSTHAVPGRENELCTARGEYEFE